MTRIFGFDEAAVLLFVSDELSVKNARQKVKRNENLIMIFGLMIEFKSKEFLIVWKSNFRNYVLKCNKYVLNLYFLS